MATCKNIWLQAAEAIKQGDLSILQSLDLVSVINNNYDEATLLSIACGQNKCCPEIIQLLLAVPTIDLNKNVSMLL